MYFLFYLYGELKASDFISVASETLMTLEPFCFKLRIMFLPIANYRGVILDVNLRKLALYTLLMNISFIKLLVKHKLINNENKRSEDSL